MRRRITLVLTALAVLAGAAASTGTRAGGTPQARTLSLGFVGPLSGQIAMNGQLSSRGAQLAVDQINAAGGLRVRGVRYRLRLVLADDQTSPVDGLNAVSRLISRDKVFAILGPEFSDVVIPTLRVTQKHKVLQLYSTNSSLGRGVGSRYAFRLRVRDTKLAQAIVDYAVRAKRRRVGLSLLNNQYGRSGGQLLSAALRRRGLSVVATSTHNFGDRDLTSNATAMVRARADAVVSWTGPAESILLYRALRGFGWKGTFMHVNPDSIYVTIGKKEVEGVVGPQGWSPADTARRSRRFVAAYRSKFDQTPDEHSAAYYDGVRLLKTAVEAVGPNPDRVRRYIANLKRWQALQGVFHPATLPGDDLVTAVVLVRVQNGRLQIIRRYR
jgi:branched-chain amino acid transport system substrate-binding protein